MDAVELEVLVSAVNEDPAALAEKMNLQTQALNVNQCDQFAYREFSIGERRIRAFSMAERGVGLSRNTALMRAQGRICLFSDEDIVFAPGYEKTVLEAFDQNPDADVITFNFKVDPSRATYYNTSRGRIRWYNYGRYPTYAVAARREALLRSGVSFSLLFGGGARYSNGEDSLFLHDCLKRGLHLYAHTAQIGEEVYRKSTWFKGYDRKFFLDRGVLYHYLYGIMAGLFSLRFLLTHKSYVKGTVKGGPLRGRSTDGRVQSSGAGDGEDDAAAAKLTFQEAYRLMRQGIREGKRRRERV